MGECVVSISQGEPFSSRVAFGDGLKPIRRSADLAATIVIVPLLLVYFLVSTLGYWLKLWR